MNDNKVIKIKPGIQHYTWGGSSYIPAWLGLENPDRQPFAEAWYGDHPLAPAVADENLVPLNQLIGNAPEIFLGKESLDTYGTRLPFLLKILDVKDMLSLQLHPDKIGAMAGFELENKAGIPLNAANRNYKDQNHKPELLYALSDFWMLQGFVPLDTIRTRFESLVPEFALPKALSWRSLMQVIWDLDGPTYITHTQSLISNLSKHNTSDKNQIYHWISKAFKQYPPHAASIDRGLLVMLMLHVQYLSPGQVGYQAPGVIHAYLEGQNVELMANSDNVLRGGLTPKHIDPIEFLKHLDADSPGQSIIKPIYLMDDEVAFNPPVHDFWLKHYNVLEGKSKPIQFDTASILLNKSGTLKCGNIVVIKGDSLLIPAYSSIQLESVESGEYFLAISSM
jgi:mannose-6-phosphate isomerase